MRLQCVQQFLKLMAGNQDMPDNILMVRHIFSMAPIISRIFQSWNAENMYELHDAIAGSCFFEDEDGQVITSCHMATLT
jgi:hypothetical protein